MGSAQAIFSHGGNTLYIGTGYLTINGNGTSTAPGCGGAPGSLVTGPPPTPSDCGIKVDNSACTSNCSNVISILAANLNVSYMEVVGDSTSSANDDIEIRNNFGGPDTWSHIYGHNAGCVYFQDGLSSWTLHDSYFWGTEINENADGCHGQFSFSAGTDSNSMVYRTVFRDITGTGVFTFANSSSDHNNWIFYDNIFFNTNEAASCSASGFGHTSDGIIACINAGTQCTNFVFNQNTVVDMCGSAGINDENSNGSYTVQNNLYWNSMANGLGFQGNSSTAVSSTAFLDQSYCASGSNNVCSSASSPVPFTNLSTFNFTLASDGANWNTHIVGCSLQPRRSGSHVHHGSRGLSVRWRGSTAESPHELKRRGQLIDSERLTIAESYCTLIRCGRGTIPQVL